MARTVALLLTWGLCGCRAPADHNDKPDAEAARLTNDAQTLATALSADEALDRLLKAADDTSARGDDEAAARLLESQGESVAREALTAARSAKVTTTWGRETQAALELVLQSRGEEIRNYATALRGSDIEVRLSALEKQVELERRVGALASEIRDRTR